MMCQHATILMQGCGNGIPSRAVRCAMNVPNPCFINCTPSCLHYQPKGDPNVRVTVPPFTPTKTVPTETGHYTPAKIMPTGLQPETAPRQYVPVPNKNKRCSSCGGGNAAAMK